MITMIASILAQRNKRLTRFTSRPSLWFALRVKLGCILDLLKARFGTGITG